MYGIVIIAVIAFMEYKISDVLFWNKSGLLVNFPS